MENQNSNFIEKEVSFKDLLLGIRSSYKLLLRKWYVILLSGLILAALLGFRAYLKPPIYEAELSFMVNEDEASSIGSSVSSSLLGRFGISTGKYNYEKIIELSRSRKILQKSLFRKIKIGNRDDFFANHIIRYYNLNKDNLDSIFYSHAEYDKFNGPENKMLYKVQDVLVGKNGIYTISVGEKSGIMRQTLTTKNDTLSVELLKYIFEDLSEFYITKSIEREKFSYDVIKAKADSLYYTINKLEYGKASFDDKTLGLWQEQKKEVGDKFVRDARINSAVYAEVLKNLEISDFTLKTKMPFIQIIDTPILPIKPDEASLLKSIIIGLFGGGLLSSLILLVRHYIQRVLNE